MSIINASIKRVIGNLMEGYLKSSSKTTKVTCFCSYNIMLSKHISHIILQILKIENITYRRQRALWTFS